MDLGTIFNHETTYPLELRHPLSGELTGVTWRIKSPHSESVKAAVRKLLDDETEQAVIAAAPPKVATLEKRNAAILAAHVASWDWGGHTFHGSVPDFSPEKVAEILLSESWIYDQVAKAKGKIGNFTAG